MTYQDRNKQLKRGLFMLDTQSNVSYARRAITERRIKKDYETNEIAGLHQTASGGDLIQVEYTRSVTRTSDSSD